MRTGIKTCIATNPNNRAWPVCFPTMSKQTVNMYTYEHAHTVWACTHACTHAHKAYILYIFRTPGQPLVYSVAKAKVMATGCVLTVSADYPSGVREPGGRCSNLTNEHMQMCVLWTWNMKVCSVLMILQMYYELFGNNYLKVCSVLRELPWSAGGWVQP